MGLGLWADADAVDSLVALWISRVLWGFPLDPLKVKPLAGDLRTDSVNINWLVVGDESHMSRRYRAFLFYHQQANKQKWRFPITRQCQVIKLKARELTLALVHFQWIHLWGIDPWWARGNPLWGVPRFTGPLRISPVTDEFSASDEFGLLFGLARSVLGFLNPACRRFGMKGPDFASLRIALNSCISF